VPVNYPNDRGVPPEEVDNVSCLWLREGIGSTVVLSTLHPPGIMATQPPSCREVSVDVHSITCGISGWSAVLPPHTILSPGVHISIWVYKWDDQKLKVVQKRGYQ